MVKLIILLYSRYNNSGKIYGAIIAIIIMSVISLIVNYKKYKVKRLIKKLNKQDAIWNFKEMNARAEEVFFKVMLARKERNQDTAKSCMSDKFYRHQKSQTDSLINEGLINFVDQLYLQEILIISISDYENNSLDGFSVRIKGSMVNYLENEKTKYLKQGSKKPYAFQEIWKFIRFKNIWVVDSVEKSTSDYGDIIKGKTFSESKHNA